MLNIFVIHWNETELHEYVTPLLLKGWNIGYEYKNETRAKLSIEKLKPDIILIYLKVTPSRGILSAKIIKDTDMIKDIPIIFIDGKTKEVKKAKIDFPNSIYITSGRLEETLEELER